MLSMGYAMGESTLTGAEPATDYSGVERAALVAWHLAHGECLTLEQAALILRMSESGAKKVLYAVSRVIPIYCYRGVWQVCAYGETIN